MVENTSTRSSLVGGELGQRLLELGERRRVQRVARLRAVEAQDLDPVVEALADDGRHGRRRSIRCAADAPGSLALLPPRSSRSLLLAPAALAQGHDGGEGWWGETNDKVVTNAGFILIAFFPLFILVMACSSGGSRSARTRRKAAAEGAATSDTARLARRLVAGAPRRRSMTDEVRYERVGAAAVLTIDRPERRNAVDGPTAERLREGFEAFEADDDARVLVLTGAGGVSFCAGADLKAIETLRPAPEPLRRGAARLHPPTRRPSRRSPRSRAGAWPAGWSWRCGATCGSPTEGSQLGFPERRWGVPLIDGGTQRLPRIVGLGRALDLILTGRIVETDEALAMGLLTEVVAPGRHLERALEMAEGARALPAGDDARRPPRRDRGLRPAAGRRAWRSRPQRRARRHRRRPLGGAARFAGGEGRGGAGAGV